MAQALSLHSEEFSGGPRFELRNKLGEGAFGTVYEAFDREHSCLVALKHLRRVTADTLYSFKQEFRSLADLSHPNLVALYEEAGLSRESLYRALSPKGNPTLKTLVAVCRRWTGRRVGAALGLQP